MIKVRYIFFIIFLLALASCASDVDIIDSKEGVFGVAGGAYSVNITKSDTSRELIDRFSAKEYAVELYEEEWTSVDVSTRALAEQDVWSNQTNIALFFEDPSTGDLIAGDKAYNPIGKYALENTLNPESTHSIVYSNDLWDIKWMKNPLLSEPDLTASENYITFSPDPVNFYGYYPRPYNKDSNGLNYNSYSIINEVEARDAYGADRGDQWNVLSYRYELQLDDNIKDYDVMVAQPAEGKEWTDDILLHFKHVFSLFVINIYKSDIYTFNPTVTNISVYGPKVYTEGKVDIKTGELSSGTSSIWRIERNISDGSITDDKPFSTEMIVHPCEITQEDDFVFEIVIDRVTYKYSMPVGKKFEGGKKYTLSLTLNPDGKVTFDIFEGAEVTVGVTTYDAGFEEMPPNVNNESFTVTPKPGFKIYRVLENGLEIDPQSENGTSKTYPLTFDNANIIPYKIITYPENWYVIDKLKMHFDGRKISKSGAVINTSSLNIETWEDLSGNDYNGTLVSFGHDGTSSGWNGVDGLLFDGINDYVSFDKGINPSEYTITFVLKFSSNQASHSHYRLTAEGPNYPCFYCLGNNTNHLYMYTHGLNTRLHSTIFQGTQNITPIQVDIVYKSNGHTGSNYKATMLVYANGQLVAGYNQKYYFGTDMNKNYYLKYDAGDATTKATIGGRLNGTDEDRAWTGTYNSYMIYNKALSAKEILQNYTLNKTRFSIQEVRTVPYEGSVQSDVFDESTGLPIIQ